MDNDYSTASGAELFVYETNQLLDKLELLILDGEKSGGLAAAMDEVFRIMHTIKGSAAMMAFQDISSLAHAVEDVFDYLRSDSPEGVNYQELTDLVLQVVDYIKNEIAEVENGEVPKSSSADLTAAVKVFLSCLKAEATVAGPVADETADDTGWREAFLAECAGSDSQKTFEATIFFDADCGMENIRAFTLLTELEEYALHVASNPPDIMENDATAEIIRHDGFQVLLETAAPIETLENFFAQTMFMREYTLKEVRARQAKPALPRTIDLDGPALPEAPVEHTVPAAAGENSGEHAHAANQKQSFISVNVAKMDLLMDLVGELVIAEAMVTQNPELAGLPLERFRKSARHLRKITGELREVVMSVRMVPLSATFYKMQRVVRDMSRKLSKQVELEIAGEQTEVDKNIIENIADPLMHLVRNAVDHGIESTEKRLERGKTAVGKIRLEAKSAGGDVWIIVQDDGGGLDREKILAKARERGLVSGDEASLSDKQIYSFILQPGFSTKENVTEFSGRGVGMDVVAKNIAEIGGIINVDSVPGTGTTMSIRIPLTLAIIDGMTVKVGNSIYTVPISIIRESFRIKDQNLITDPDNNEMIMIRGQCYPILRLYERFGITPEVTEFNKGIMIMVEVEEKSICLFADSLIGQQQVVVKGLPGYIKKMKGIAGCTLLGDGSVSLILDAAGLIQ